MRSEPYNLALRTDDAMIDELAEEGIAYVPYFPLGGFTPLQSATLSEVAAGLRRHTDAGGARLAAAARAKYPLIPGTSSLAHLRENLAAAELKLPDDAVEGVFRGGGQSKLNIANCSRAR